MTLHHLDDHRYGDRICCSGHALRRAHRDADAALTAYTGDPALLIPRDEVLRLLSNITLLLAHLIRYGPGVCRGGPPCEVVHMPTPTHPKGGRR